MTPTPTPNPSLSSDEQWAELKTLSKDPEVRAGIKAAVGLFCVFLSLAAIDWRLGTLLAGIYLIAAAIATKPSEATKPTDPQ